MSFPAGSFAAGSLGAVKRLAAAVVLVLAAVAPAQTPDDAVGAAQAQVSFRYERPGLPVPRFTLTVNEDGSARYEAEQVFEATRSGLPETQQIDRQIVLSRASTGRIFADARSLDRFTARCATPAKNIADTGTKTLRYAGADGGGSCVYNYSQDKRVAGLTDLFLAIAATLDMGRKLDFDHRFDRLGLDAAMQTLVEQVDAGRAVELGTIRGTLKSIAQDSEVLERVRLRAAKLLQQSQPGM